MTTVFPQCGERIQLLHATRALELELETYGKSQGRRRWAVSSDPEHARWVETFAATRSPVLLRAAGTDPFALLARAKLEGGRVTGFDPSAPGLVRLTVATEEGTYALVLELVRPYPNLLLLDADETVRGMQRPGPAARGLRVGQRYAPPPAPRVLGGALPRTPPTAPGEAGALDAQWNERLAAADLDRSRTAAARLTRQAVTRLERRLERLEADRLAADEAERFRRGGELHTIHGPRGPRGAAALRVPDEFEPGRPEVTIPLDPAQSLTENIARLFRQYRKRQASAAHVQRRLAETRRELQAARSAAQGVAEAQTLPELERELLVLPGRRAEPPAPSGPRGAHSPGRATGGAAGRESGRTPGRKADRTPDRSFGRTAGSHLQRTSSEGWTILVGRSAQDNDALTFRAARGRDWWLHAVGFSGSHVVVRNPAGGALPHATLREAAWLAAYYSKARSQGRVEVAYVERKHVRRVPKGNPGAVTFDHGRTLWVDLADERLARVLREPGPPLPAGEDPSG